MSLLEENTTRKGWIDKNVTEFEASKDNKEYKVEKIWNNAVYAKKLATCHLLDLSYLISWKGYPEKKNT